MITGKAIELGKISLIDMPNLFACILAAKDKYPVVNRVNLTKPVEMQLSLKQKSFSEVFSSFMKSSLNSEHFEEKDKPHRFCISEFTDSEIIVR